MRETQEYCIGEKAMIGFYDYTVILTYLSLLSAVLGMVMTVTGHPIIATMCLLFCGLCDMFDGKVARSKKNRTAEEKSFGIQIDSLTDIVAFGILPAMIMLFLCGYSWYAYIIAALYVLAGLIRLAYFNVTEADLLSQRRNREIATARQVAMYLTREQTRLSTTRIGDLYGGRDHTTVMHACDKIAELAETDDAIRSAIQALKK